MVQARSTANSLPATPSTSDQPLHVLAGASPSSVSGPAEVQRIEALDNFLVLGGQLLLLLLRGRHQISSINFGLFCLSKTVLSGRRTTKAKDGLLALVELFQALDLS